MRAAIHAALGGAMRVLNVGAGTGSYEPSDRTVVAVEPSAVMLEQRPDDAAPAVRAVAAHLPCRDASFDAAMAVLTIHHWGDALASGLAELRRVSRGPIVIVTYDAEVCGRMWLVDDYFPEAGALDAVTFPTIDALTDALGGRVEVAPLPVARDTPDWTFGAFWAHPERVLDPAARAATSGFARQPAAVVDRVVAAVRRDLASGAWDRRHGHLRDLEEFDVGMRLVVALG